MLGAFVGLSALSSAVASAAEPGWLDPVDVGPNYLYAAPKLGLSAGGGFVQKWQEQTANGLDSLHVAEIPASGADVHRQTLDGLASTSDLASDPEGGSIVAWPEMGSYQHPVKAVIKPPGGAFGAPVDAMPYPYGFVDAIRVAVNRRGDSIVVVEVDTSNRFQLIAVFRPAGGSFSRPVAVSGAYDANFQNFAIALSDEGEAVVAWDAPTACANPDCTANRFPQVITAAIGTASGGFGSPQVLSDPSTEAHVPQLAVDPAGGAVVAWKSGAEHVEGDYFPEYPVVAAIRRPGGAFSGPTKVGQGGDGHQISVGVDGAGHGLVAYANPHSDLTVVPFDARDGSWRNGREVVRPVQDARLAVGRDGTALLTWTSASSSWVAWGDSDGNFPLVRNLTCTDGWPSLHAAVVASHEQSAVMLATALEAPDAHTAVLRASGDVAPSTELCWPYFPEPLGGTQLAASTYLGGPPRGPSSEAPAAGPPGAAPAASSAAGGAAAPSAPPAAEPRVFVQLQRRLAMHGRTAIQIPVTWTSPGILTVSARLASGSRRRLLSDHRRVASPGSSVLTVRLPRGVLRGLRRAGSAQLTVEASLTRPDRHSASRSTRVRLTR